MNKFADDFLNAAPDSKPGVAKGDLRQISLAMPEELLVRLMAAAKERNIGRAALVRMALTKYLDEL